MLIPAMKEAGWEVEVLYPDQSYQAAYSFDPECTQYYPEVSEHPVGSWMPGIFRALGSRSIGIRGGAPLARQGLELLQSRKYDLVYFSTTQHLLTCAGPWWRKKTGVPYVADVHDPVFIPHPKYRTSRNGLKAILARQMGRWIERRALAQADGIVSVSRGYIDDLLLRNPCSRWARSEMEDGRRKVGLNKLGHVLVQPFPADERALEMAKAERGRAGKKRIVYVGAGGTIMEKGWREFLAALKKESASREIIIEIYGTNPFWKEGDRRFLQAIAEEMGLPGVVIEEPTRVSYERSLALVKGADGLLVLGVDDPNYQPSKLHTYLATGLPIMVLARAGSALPDQLRGVGDGVGLLEFGEGGRGQLEGGIRCYLEAVKGANRWPGRRFLTAGEGVLAHIKFFEKVTRK